MTIRKARGEATGAIAVATAPAAENEALTVMVLADNDMQAADKWMPQLALLSRPC